MRNGWRDWLDALAFGAGAVMTWFWVHQASKPDYPLPAYLVFGVAAMVCAAESLRNARDFINRGENR